MNPYLGYLEPLLEFQNRAYLYKVEVTESIAALHTFTQEITKHSND